MQEDTAHRFTDYGRRAFVCLNLLVAQAASTEYAGFALGMGLAALGSKQPQQFKIMFVQGCNIEMKGGLRGKCFLFSSFAYDEPGLTTIVQ